MGESLCRHVGKAQVVEIMTLADSFPNDRNDARQNGRYKTLIELNLRAKEQRNACRNQRWAKRKVIVLAGGDCKLLPDDMLIIAGSVDDTKRLQQ